MRKNLCLFLCALFLLVFNGTSRGQIISTFAGNGTSGYTGDGGPATIATLSSPAGVSYDPFTGNVYIGGFGNGVVRKVNTLGIINSAVGNGTTGNTGDGAPATAALITSPMGTAADGAGNVYIADLGANVVRKVDIAGIITTVAGNGTSGFGGDGGPATAAQLAQPTDVAVDALGNLYIADQANSRIRKVDALGNISTVAGTILPGYTADGIAATLSSLSFPTGVAVDGSGNLYIADQSNNRVRMVDAMGIITTIAGNGISGFSGDGAAATAATLAAPTDVIIDNYGRLYLADKDNNRVRKIDAAGIISTIAGTGVAAYSGDGSAATAAELSTPYNVALNGNGNLLIADFGNNVIRFVQMNNAPAFTGGPNQAIAVCQDAPPASIDGAMSVNDVDAGQTLTWTVTAAPVNGTLSGFPYTTTSTGGTVTPTGLTYTPTAGYSGSDIFTIEVADSNGGFATTQVNVTINPTPSLLTPSNQNVCNGAVTAAVNFSGPISGTTYSWSNSNTTIGLAASGTGNIASFTATHSSVSVITATITVTPSANGCQGTPISFTITVNPTPDVTGAADQAVCNSQSTMPITFMGAVTGTVYNWTNDQPTIGIGSFGTGDILSFTAINASNIPITANLLVTPSINGCNGTSVPFTITVNPTPIVVDPADQALCNGASTAAILFGGSVVGTTYNWTNSNPGIGIPAIGSGDIVSFAVANATPAIQTATVIVTPVANTCFGASENFVITVYPTPTLSSSLTPPSVCNNTLFHYVSTSATPGTTFTWNRELTPGISNPAASGTDTIHEVLINTGSTQVIVTYIDTLRANGCTNTQNITVAVNPTPLLNSAVTATVCDSQVFAYTPTSPVVGATFMWTRNFVLGIDLPAATGTGNISEKIVNNHDTALKVTYMYSIAASGCTDTKNVVVTVNPTPRLSSPLSASVCSAVPFNYTATGRVAGTSFTWTRAAVAGITPASNSGTGNISETLTTTNSTPTDVVYVYTKTANGCSNKQAVIVTVNPAPAVPVIDNNAPGSICAGTMYQGFSTSVAAPAGVGYKWTATNAEVYATGSNRQHALVNFGGSGTATITLTAVATGGCTASNSISINVGPGTADAPAAVAYLNNQFVCLQNNEEGYQWGYDDVATLQSTSLAGEINQNYYNPNADFKTKNYWVIVSHNGCKQKAYYNRPLTVVNNTEAASVKVFPNPANDNVNVEITGTQAITAQVEVFNMLGQAVRTATTTDGKATIDINGLPAGIYLINCTSNDVKIATARFIKN